LTSKPANCVLGLSLMIQVLVIGLGHEVSGFGLGLEAHRLSLGD